jgi:hypothetical protein
MRRRRLVALAALLPFGAVQAQAIEVIELRFRGAWLLVEEIAAPR